MERETVELVKKLWKTWDVRVLMHFSLIIQALLTFLAPYRKRCASTSLSFSMWLLYLGADAVALFTIGLIASSDDEPRKVLGQKAHDLLPFWAPFLLLHLGGPDTITALALEDNQLWHRHGLQLVTQVVVTIYALVRTFRRNHLLFATVLMFFDGFVKYLERTCALYYASMETFRDSQRTKPEPGPNYARLMEEFSSSSVAHIPTEIKGDDNGPSNMNHVDNVQQATNNNGGCGSIIQVANHATSPKETDVMILDAYRFYDMFKGLLADAFLSLKDRDESRAVFLSKPPHEAFRMVQIELNFMYDVFYSKVFLLHRRRGYVRLLCFLSVVVSILLFSFSDKSAYESIDVGITYALLGGAIALDLFAALMFILSDWLIIIGAHWGHKPNLLTSTLKLLLKCSTRARGLCCCRWSESISGYNLLNRCLKDPPRLLDYIFIRQIQHLFIGWYYVATNPIDSQLVSFIIEQLHTKAQLATDTWANKEVCSARGTLVFQEDFSFVAEYLRPWTADVDYDESLLTWHFATDICYWTSTNKDDRYVQFCKTLSDYMSYLVLQQKTLVSPVVGTSDIRFDNTRAEVKKFVFNTLMLHPSVEKSSKGETDRKLMEQFCAKILQVQTPVRPMVAKGDKSKSVLFDSCCLAKQLKLFGESQWEITSKVWVELLCYAAVRCSPVSHVSLLSKGGELITLVWLLMAHFGLGERFRQYRGFGWTKLIIHK